MKSAKEEELCKLLLPIFPGLKAVSLIGDPIVQASAVGYRCELHLQNTDVQRVFCKHVDATTYCSTKKDWNDLRRALLYARTEARFYTNFRTGLESCTPRVHHASYNLEGLVDDAEHVTAAGKRTDLPTKSQCEGKGGLLVLELVEDLDYFQASPLTISQCKQCLAAIARLHKSVWQKQTILESASDQLAIPTFHLQLRNPKELAGISHAWDRFRVEFQDFFSDELWKQTTDLGERIKLAAPYISKQLSPKANDPYTTLVHGDFKSMNAFLHRRSEHSALLVDFAAIGIGFPMMDVAMHVSHAVLPDDLKAIQESGKSGEMELIDYYWQCLTCKDDGGIEYPKDIAVYHYKLAFCDYFRFFLGRMWSTATVESMQSKADNPNINNINRSPVAAIAFIERAEVYLKEIEEEQRTQMDSS